MAYSRSKSSIVYLFHALWQHIYKRAVNNKVLTYTLMYSRCEFYNDWIFVLSSTDVEYSTVIYPSFKVIV